MTTPRIEISKIAAETMLVPIRGTAPLIVHNFSEKSKRQMLDAQQGKKKLKEIRDPQAEILFGGPEVLVPAAALVNGGTIRRAPCPVVRYVHFACARPQIVFAEGIPTETLNPGDYGLSCLGPRQRMQLLRALPDLLEQGGQPAARPCLSVFEGRLLSAALPAAL